MSNDECPDPDTLRRFTLGLVDDAEAWPIEAHLSGCMDCSATLDRSLAPDGLVLAMRMRSAILDAADDPEVTTLSSRLHSLVPADDEIETVDGPTTASHDPTWETDEFGRVGHFRVFEMLGRGGMGVVYRAEDTLLKRQVALKVLLAARFLDPVHQARFQREAETLARLRHPGIVAIHEVGTHRVRPFLALEYLEGGTLAEYLLGRMQPIRESARLIERLARAVHYAHEQGIIHRDLKPGNVLLASKTGDRLASAKISDFGLARRLDESGLTETGDVLGTPGYLAPEQTVGRGGTAGPAADVYSLGAMLYELLTGRPPHSLGE